MVTLFLLLSHMALIQTRHAECQKYIHTLVVPKAPIPSLPSVIPTNFPLRTFICVLILWFANTRIVSKYDVLICRKTRWRSPLFAIKPIFLAPASILLGTLKATVNGSRGLKLKIARNQPAIARHWILTKIATPRNLPLKLPAKCPRWYMPGLKKE